MKLTRYSTRLIIVAMITAACCTLTGFAAGFTYGTGTPAITLIIPPVAIAPPVNTSITALDNITRALGTQPKQPYRIGYNCVDFAWDAMRLLEWKGQPSAIVRVDFADASSHAILLVPTADNGYQFIEPQDNIVIKPQVGGIYGGKSIVAMSILSFTWEPFDIFLLDPNYGVDK